MIWINVHFIPIVYLAVIPCDFVSGSAKIIELTLALIILHNYTEGK